MFAFRLCIPRLNCSVGFVVVVWCLSSSQTAMAADLYVSVPLLRLNPTALQQMQDQVAQHQAELDALTLTHRYHIDDLQRQVQEAEDARRQERAEQQTVIDALKDRVIALEKRQRDADDKKAAKEQRREAKRHRDRIGVSEEVDRANQELLDSLELG